MAFCVAVVRYVMSLMRRCLFRSVCVLNVSSVVVLLLMISSSLNSVYAATADCSSKHINVASLSLCVWDNNSDGVPDASSLVCALDYLPVWSRPYGATNLTAQCLSVSYFPAVKPTVYTVMPTPMYVVTCNVAWTTTASGQLVCPMSNQVVVDVSSGILWHGFDAYVQYAIEHINPNLAFWAFGAFSLIWALGVGLGMLQRFLRRFS